MKDIINDTGRISREEILLYEVRSHWLASWVFFSWGQEIMARYLARKVKRKYRRYSNSLENQERILNNI